MELRDEHARSSATARAPSRPSRHSPTGRSATTSSSRTTTWSSTRSASAARPETSTAHRSGQPIRGPSGARATRCRRCAAPGWTELTAAAARGLGWHPFPRPAAINSEPYNGQPACTYCGFCTYTGCYRNAKGSTDTNVIRASRDDRPLQSPAPGSRASCPAGRDRWSAPPTSKDGHEHFCRRAVVLLGTFTYENTRLLLLSASKPFPHGLANNLGQVGSTTWRTSRRSPAGSPTAG